jgi:hypothetical protein
MIKDGGEMPASWYPAPLHDPVDTLAVDPSRSNHWPRVEDAWYACRFDCQLQCKNNVIFRQNVTQSAKGAVKYRQFQPDVRMKRLDIRVAFYPMAMN